MFIYQNIRTHYIAVPMMKVSQFNCAEKCLMISRALLKPPKSHIGKHRISATFSSEDVSVLMGGNRQKLVEVPGYQGMWH